MGFAICLRASWNKCRMLLRKRYKRKLFALMDRDHIKAMELFYALTSQEVFKKIVNATKSSQVAARITIEVYTTLWASRGRLKAVASPRRHLFEIVARVLLGYLGNPGEHQALLQRYALCQGRCIVRPGSFPFTQKKLDMLINTALLQLPPVTRQILTMYYYQYFSIPEISAELQKSEIKITTLLITGVQQVEAFLKSRL